MDFKSKLARLNSAGPTPSSPVVVAPHVAELRTYLEGMREREGRRRRRARPELSMPGAPVTSATGSVHCIKQIYDAAHQHGATPLAWSLEATNAHITHLTRDAALAQVDLSRLLFLDTETTGLAGGAGTVAFLVGLAWFEGTTLHLEQLLLRNFGDEPAMLERLLQRLTTASCVVTYNGKSFDWPLLRSRCVMHRFDAPVFPHIDLLHCARRVFGRRNMPLRLTGLETEIMGFIREDDIPGADIPATYFRFLRGASIDTLTAVVTHNAHDILAMVAALGLLAKRLDSPEASHDARDRLALAELAWRNGERARAATFALSVVQATHGGGGFVSATALMLASRLAKESGDGVAAVELLRRALEQPALAAELIASIHLALSKIYEHQLRDYAGALDHALHTRACEGDLKSAARRARLQQKMMRRPPVKSRHALQPRL